MAGLVHALNAIVQQSDDVYAVEIENIEVVFRLPSVKQAHQYITLLSLTTDASMQSLIYEHVFKSVVVDSFMANNDSDLPAGIPETISKLVFYLSGVDEQCTDYTEEVIESYRKQANSILLFMKRIICQVFSGYTFESLDRLNYQNLLTIFVQAEKVMLDNEIIKEPYVFKQPEAKNKPYKVEDVIKQDVAAQKRFEKPNEKHPHSMANRRRLSEEAKRRSETAELRHKRNRRR